MKITQYKLLPPAPSTGFTASFSTAVLDQPSLKDPTSTDKIKVSGWIIPTGNTDSYKLVIQGDDLFCVEIQPNTPRPDVASRLGALPLAGDTIFKGFYAEIPFFERLRISVIIGNDQFLWKELVANEFDLDLLMCLRQQLVGRSLVKINEDAASQWKRLDEEVKRFYIDLEHSSIVLLGEEGVEISSKIQLDERLYFLNFVKFVSSAEFFAYLLKRNTNNKAVEIPAPFFDARARLVGSFFNEINFLIFEVSGVRFYIGQYIHTCDFVYFPDRALCFRSAHSLYDHQHLKKLLSYVVDCPDAFERALSGNGMVEAVLINGTSPYHFFYDCIPSLYVARNSSNLPESLLIYSLGGACFFPLDIFFGNMARIENKAVTPTEWNEISCNDAPLTVLAGTSYRTLSREDLDQLDTHIVECAEVAGKGMKISSILGGLKDRFPVLWLGISAQKRAWLNQEKILLSLIGRLSLMYPKLAIVFDGLTSNIFDEPVNDGPFAVDRKIVDRLISALPAGVPGFDLVGMSSAEKIRVCKIVHFYVANYGTGSIYPARFLRLPGVAHWSRSLFDAAKDAHIHYDTNVVPLEHVTDFPDLESSRLDFISYELDLDIFISLVEKELCKKVSYCSLRKV